MKRKKKHANSMSVSNEGTKQRNESISTKNYKQQTTRKIECVWLHLNGNNNSPIISLLFADEEYPFQYKLIHSARIHRDTHITFVNSICWAILLLLLFFQLFPFNYITI